MKTVTNHIKSNHSIYILLPRDQPTIFTTVQKEQRVARIPHECGRIPAGPNPEHFPLFDRHPLVEGRQGSPISAA